MHRRQFIAGGAAALMAAALRGQDLPGIGAAEAFDFEVLKRKAKTLAEQPYQPRSRELPESIRHLSWDDYQELQYKADYTLWDEGSPFAARFFHLGLFFQSAVQIYQVENGLAQRIAYDRRMFDYGDSGADPAELPPDLGFAGFRILSSDDMTRDIAAFLGASYFRAVGSEKQYGLSARGLAVDTAMPYPEEFPDFTAFWLLKPPPGAKELEVYALLDSPSIAGAYRFLIRQGERLSMEVEAELYPRTAIARLGIAPCTSMFQHGENDRRMAWDWRPEIHDSDGLQLHTGTGEWIWRPLENPAQLRFNAFIDEQPRGFGLIQRDRNFDHYLDDGVFYDRRPSLWVQPQGDWGRGAVNLVEIPTVDETFDNIVCFWTPETPPQPGRVYTYRYTLYWGGLPPEQTPLARCSDTYTGLGGVVGQKRDYYSRRFAIDFVGDIFARLPEGAEVEAVVSASRGEIELVSARPQPQKKGYRAMFDLRPDESTAQIDLRLYLKHGEDSLSETWLYQWNPPPPEQRELY